MATNPLSPAPVQTPFADANGNISNDWNRYFFNTYDTVNSLAGFAVSPNLLINGSYNFQVGISTPLTQAAGNGAYIAQTWQIYGADNAEYTVTSTAYGLLDD
jgi:VCBS repeat-containing protein